MHTYGIPQAEWELDPSDWSLSADSGWSGAIEVRKKNGGLLVKNTGENAILLTYKHDIFIKEKTCKALITICRGENLLNGAGCVYINDHSVPLNSETNMEIKPPLNLHITLKVAANSALWLEKVSLHSQEQAKDLTECCERDRDILVITPDYPSTHNLYMCAFAHTRNRGYVSAGLKVQVVSISKGNWYQTVYEMDGVPVFRGRYVDLKNLLSRHQFKAIVTHFADECLYPIFDGYIRDEQLIFICHGPETVFRYLSKPCGTYFTKELPALDSSHIFDNKERYVKLYAQKENVEWVFVSEWLKNFSEKLLQVKFKNSRVIYNTINEKLFPYTPKTKEDRKKILILRKFDNVRQHSIDQIVAAIETLSRRKFFYDLTFEVYGDGNCYDVLVEPLKKFSNVHLHRTFIPNDKIHEIHAQSGILLIPSRHDAHAVAMSEGASSGLVVVGSDVTSNGYFMNQAVNHTLADPEDPHALADIIERLYQNPDEFLEISARMSQEIQERCCRENTVFKEIELIREKMQVSETFCVLYPVRSSDTPVLTIVVPAYNVEAYLDKCLTSLVRHRNLSKTEIIVINDGSKDNTLVIAQRFKKMTNGIVRVIDKENGGHGSAINAGIKHARGKYFRLIDGDDWVDSENLAKLVDKLEHETADLVLTKGSYEYVEQAELVNIIDYDMLHEGTLYYFDSLIYPGYGFQTYGPLLTTGNYRTECLRRSKFQISEKRPYVDMEFNSFALCCIETLRYYELDIYRYLIGREGQTISRETWKKKFQDHQYVIFNILRTINLMDDYSKVKKKYVYEHILAMMIDSQIFMYDQLCRWEDIDTFIAELSRWPEALEAGLDYIARKNGDCMIIMNQYRDRLQGTTGQRNPIIGGDPTPALPELGKKSYSWKWYLKKVLKACVPYGVLRLYQMERYPNGI